MERRLNVVSNERTINKGNVSDQNTIFLATTALEEFWDTSRPILFLGEWCRRYSRRALWEPLESSVLRNPWENEQQVQQAYQFTAELYERLLPLLGKKLNTVHGTSHAERYWRVVLGPWLHWYIPVVYDRYQFLRTALAIDPEVTSIVLDEESWTTPSDTLEYIQLIKDDPYNLQIFSRILEALGRSFPKKNHAVIAKPFTTRRQQWSFRNVFNAFVFRSSAVLGKIVTTHRQPIILRDTYFAPAVELKLIVRSSCTVWPVLGRSKQHDRQVVNKAARMTLHDILSPANEFERVIDQILPLDIPLSFLEEFTSIRSIAEQTYPDRPRAIFSSSAWYFDEAFKQWSGAEGEKGTLLLGMQHGGNYGSLALHPSEDHEISITDRYFSWGWDRTSHALKVVPAFATKLSGRRPLGADNDREGILYVTTSLPRYLFQFPFMPIHFQDYLAWQSRFLKAVSPELLRKLRMRPHREDFGWDRTRQLHDSWPGITLEQWNIPFWKSLRDCRLYVGDKLATTFTEALSANKPAILFWDPAHNRLRPEARPYYELLRSAGILHDSPEAAAAAIGAVYDDVETWWNDPVRQDARSRFCERFARTSSQVVDEWLETFKKISKEGLPAD